MHSRSSRDGAIHYHRGAQEGPCCPANFEVCPRLHITGEFPSSTLMRQESLGYSYRQRILTCVYIPLNCCKLFIILSKSEYSNVQR